MVEGGAAMEACHNQKKNMVLHAHGELDSKIAKEVENHLAGCEFCRAEYRQLVSLLGNIKEAAASPELSPKQINSLVTNIKWKLNKRDEDKWWRRYLNYSPSRMIPVIAAACILVVIVGIIGYVNINKTSQVQQIAGQQNENLMLSDKDLEIVKNLEFLKEMDAIQKLSRVVDPAGEVNSPGELDEETRGMRQDAYRKFFV
jgi:hypothetical protein